MPTIALRLPEFSFLKVAVVQARPDDSGPMDLITWRHLVATALTRDHGLLGSSVHVDILHQYSVEKAARETEQEEAILIRVPRVDKRMVWGSVSGYHDPSKGLALRVLGVSDHLVALL